VDIDCWWSDTDREKPKCSEKNKAVLLPHRPPQIPHRFVSEIQPGPPRCWDIQLAPKVCSVDPKKSATSSQDIRARISVMGALKLSSFLIERIPCYFKNRGTSVIDYVFLSYDSYNMYLRNPLYPRSQCQSLWRLTTTTVVVPHR